MECLLIWKEEKWKVVYIYIHEEGKIQVMILNVMYSGNEIYKLKVP